MKVAFFMHNAGAVHGAERATLDLAGPLVERGLAVEVWLIDERRGSPVDRAFEEALAAAGCTVRKLPATGAFSRELLVGLCRERARQKPDVLHTIGYKANVHTRLALWGQKGDGCVWVTTVHGWLFRHDLKERFYGWLDVWAMKRAGAVIVLSDFYRQLLQQRMPKQKVVMIPTGLPDADVDMLAPKTDRAQDAPLVFGMLGRLSEEKNHALLLDAVTRVAQRWPNKGLRVLIAGDGPLRDHLEQRIHQSGLNDVVSLAGPMPREAFFQQVDVLVQCSLIENRPYTIMEAFAAGVPVIGTRVGGIPELITHEEDGLLVRLDAAELTEALGTFIEDRGRVTTMAATARHHAEQHFRAGPCVDAHIALYREGVGVC